MSLPTNTKNKQCRIEDCDRSGALGKNGKRYLTKGLCRAHYQRLRKYGVADIASAGDKRPAVIVGEVAKIPLGKGAKDGYAVVDREYGYLGQYKWSLASSGYPRGHTLTKKAVYLHHVILESAGQGLMIDHIDGDPKNNRRNNLRFVTQSQNQRNSKKRNSKYKYKGVYHSGSSWCASVAVHGKKYYISGLTSEEEAALAYNELSLRHHGEYGRPNQID